VILITACSGENFLIAEKKTHPAIKIIKLENLKPTKTGEIHYQSRREFLEDLPQQLKKINSQAIKEAQDKNYNEALFLFEEVGKYIQNGTAENNRAIILEMQNKKHEAFILYSQALSLNPESSVIKKNFLIFLTEQKMDYQKTGRNR